MCVYACENKRKESTKETSSCKHAARRFHIFSVKTGVAIALPDHKDVKVERHKEKKQKQLDQTSVTTDFSAVYQYLSWSLDTVITGTADFLDFSFSFPYILGVCYIRRISEGLHSQ